QAHPDLFNILLQVFDDGHLTDGLGNRVNFKNTIIIMTSNIGARFIQKKAGLGFQTADAGAISRSVNDMVLGEVRKTFNPEFINRIDEIIVFDALSDDDLRTITRLLVKQLNDNLVDRKIRLDLSTEVVDWVIEQTCKDRSYGARPLRRAIQRYIEDPLSEELIRGHLKGGEIDVYLDGGSLAYRPAGQTQGGRRLARRAGAIPNAQPAIPKKLSTSDAQDSQGKKPRSSVANSTVRISSLCSVGILTLRVLGVTLRVLGVAELGANWELGVPSCGVDESRP